MLLGPGVIALLGVPGVFRSRYGALIWPLALVFIASLLTKASNPHYVAPVLGILYLAFGAGLSSLHRTARRRRFANLAICVVRVFASYIPYEPDIRVTPAQQIFAEQRATALAQLESRPDKSLVVVHYGPQHNYFEEWVYNRADIDNAKVVWARSMGDEGDRLLTKYFADRTVWTIAVDADARLRTVRVADDR